MHSRRQRRLNTPSGTCTNTVLQLHANKILLLQNYGMCGAPLSSSLSNTQNMPRRRRTSLACSHKQQLNFCQRKVNKTTHQTSTSGDMHQRRQYECSERAIVSLVSKKMGLESWQPKVRRGLGWNVNCPALADMWTTHLQSIPVHFPGTHLNGSVTSSFERSFNTSPLHALSQNTYISVS